MTHASSFSVVLPVYNEKENLELLLQDLAEVLHVYPYAEVIAVDDGSTDGSRQLLGELVEKYAFLKTVLLARNYGQTAAIAAGMEHAKGDVIIPMDSDRQNDPKDIPRFLAEIDKGFDVVSGWRRHRNDAGLRSFFSRVANRMIRRASGQSIHDYGCTMKAYRRDITQNIGLYGEMHRLLVAYTALQGAKISEIEVTHHPRTKGVSKYGFGRIWRVLLDLLVLVFFLKSFTRPMHFFGGVGLLFNLLGFATIVFALLWRFVGGPTLIDTPLPTLSALFVIIGVQCILMGVLAEMSMRVYFRVQPHTHYKVHSVLTKKS